MLTARFSIMILVSSLIASQSRGFAFSRSGLSSSVSRSILKMSASGGAQTLPIKAGEEVMSPKEHGTSEKPVQQELRWGCDFQTADRICNFNRHYAEFAGYWQTKKEYLQELMVNKEKRSEPIKYYDSVTGKLLFTAPIGRTMDEYISESMSHGWPSFRDEEVNWEFVRCLPDGECVSTTGTHLGHNLPDKKGNRYCINLVSVAGQPEA